MYMCSAYVVYTCRRKWLEGHVALPPKSQFRGQCDVAAWFKRCVTGKQLRTIIWIAQFKLRFVMLICVHMGQNTVIRMIRNSNDHSNCALCSRVKTLNVAFVGQLLCLPFISQYVRVCHFLSIFMVLFSSCSFMLFFNTISLFYSVLNVSSWQVNCIPDESSSNCHSLCILYLSYSEAWTLHVVTHLSSHYLFISSLLVICIPNESSSHCHSLCILYLSYCEAWTLHVVTPLSSRYLFSFLPSSHLHSWRSSCHCHYLFLFPPSHVFKCNLFCFSFPCSNLQSMYVLIKYGQRYHRLFTHESKVPNLNDLNCTIWITQCTHERSNYDILITQCTHESLNLRFSITEREKMRGSCLGTLPIKHAQSSRFLCFSTCMQRAVYRRKWLEGHVAPPPPPNHNSEVKAFIRRFRCVIWEMRH